MGVETPPPGAGEYTHFPPLHLFLNFLLVFPFQRLALISTSRTRRQDAKNIPDMCQLLGPSSARNIKNSF